MPLRSLPVSRVILRCSILLQLTMLRSWYPSLRWPRRSASFSFRSS
ncbi:Uncharacterised protein [Segatella copri]|nr:Uncharacterised protein [Segatella copri]